MQPSKVCLWLQGILEAALSEGDMKQVACPHPSCRLPLPFQLALSLLNSAQAERYQQLLAQHHVDTNPYIKWYVSPILAQADCCHFDTDPPVNMYAC